MLYVNVGFRCTLEFISLHCLISVFRSFCRTMLQDVEIFFLLMSLLIDPSEFT